VSRLTPQQRWLTVGRRWDQLRAGILSHASREVGTIYRNDRVRQYDVVPMSSCEASETPILEKVISRKLGIRSGRGRGRTGSPVIPFYTGTDGATLWEQPRRHHKHWTEEQWLASIEFAQQTRDGHVDGRFMRESPQIVIKQDLLPTGVERTRRDS